jgi:predicted GNAT superfamily acetyltransferase
VTGRDDAARAASQARHDAVGVAERSGVAVRPLHDLADLAEAVKVVDGIWKPAPGDPLLTTELLRALSHAGNYVVGAFDGAEMVGTCVGFLARTPSPALHSHIAGVSEAARGRSIGLALKLHQRAWALERGLCRITWTADPLVRRNAHFNLVKLGARPAKYYVDFYGEIDDEINGGQGTDRLLLHWDLDSPAVSRACQGTHSATPALNAVQVVAESGSGRPEVKGDHHDANAVLVAVPADIEALRRTDPEHAREWRLAVRSVLADLIGGGWQVTGFSHPGSYVVERAES